MLSNRLPGRWRLTTYEASNAQGVMRLPMGQGAMGVLEYSRDRKVSVHMMTRDASGYLAYYGDYEIDEARGTVTHVIEMSSIPGFVGARNLRHATLEGEGTAAQLVLTGPMLIDDEPHTIRVVWVRDGRR